MFNECYDGIIYNNLINVKNMEVKFDTKSQFN